MRRLGSVIVALAIAVGLGSALWCRRAGCFPLRIEGDSMRPLLPSGALVVAVPLRATSPALMVGQVILGRRPDRPAVELVKRIAAGPGDRFPRAGRRGDALPADEYFLLGDNPSRSTDSRHFGPVRREEIRAVIVLRYWPLPLRLVSRRTTRD